MNDNTLEKGSDSMSGPALSDFIMLGAGEPIYRNKNFIVWDDDDRVVLGIIPKNLTIHMDYIVWEDLRYMIGMDGYKKEKCGDYSFFFSDGMYSHIWLIDNQINLRLSDEEWDDLKDLLNKAGSPFPWGKSQEK